MKSILTRAVYMKSGWKQFINNIINQQSGNYDFRINISNKKLNENTRELKTTIYKNLKLIILKNICVFLTNLL